MNLKLTTLVSALVLAATTVMAEDGTVVSKASEKISINGDLRLRHENRDRDRAGVTDSRNRLRHRFRLGLDFKTAYGWDISAGLATGGSDATSTNQTWSDNTAGGDGTFGTGDIRLDYAYAKHTFGENTVVTLGQQKNPFIDSEILWDGDVRQTGGFVQQKFGVGFLTAGYMNVGYTNSPSMAEMLGAQGGIKLQGDVPVTAAISYYHANSHVAKDIYGFGDATDYDFDYIDFYADLGFKASDNAEIKFFAEYGINIGADDVDTQMAVGGDPVPVGYFADDNNEFYTIGATVKIIKKVKVKAQYVVIEGDGVFGGLNNSDFGDGINTGAGNIDVKGYIVGVGYDLTKNCNIGITYLAAESIERDDLESNITQIDLVYKF